MQKETKIEGRVLDTDTNTQNTATSVNLNEAVISDGKIISDKEIINTINDFNLTKWFDIVIDTEFSREQIEMIIESENSPFVSLMIIYQDVPMDILQKLADNWRKPIRISATGKINYLLTLKTNYENF